MLMIHFVIFLLFHRLDIIRCFPTECLFKLIDPEHRGNHLYVYGNDSFVEHPFLLSILADSPLAVTLADVTTNAQKRRPTAYLLFIPLRDEIERVVDQAHEALRQLSSRCEHWFPSAKTFVVLIERDGVEYSGCKPELVAKIMYHLWKYKVYDNVIFIASELGEKGETWTASPFDKDNICGERVRVLVRTKCSSTQESSDNKTIDLKRSLKRSQNFSDCLVRVSTRESPPFAFKTSDGYAGSDVQFIHLFSEVTHARIEWQERPSPESGLPKRVVLAYYYQIRNGVIDLAIGGAVLRSEFDSIVDYLRPHGEHRLTIYVPDGDIISALSSLYCMFSWTLWFTVLLTTFLGGIFLHFLEFLRQIFSKGKRHFSDGEVFLTVVAILLEQSCWKKPHRSLSHRLFLGSFCVGILFISSLYKIFLQSYTVRPPLSTYVRTFDDLVDFNYTVVVSDLNMNTLKQSSVSRLKRIKSWVSGAQSSQKTLEALDKKRNFAFLERNRFVEYLLRDGGFRIHALEDSEIDTLSTSLIMPKGSEYRKQVESLLTKTIESGLYTKWMSDIVSKHHTKVSDEPRTLGVTDFWAVFCLLVTGHFLACLFLIAELIMHRVRAKWPHGGSNHEVDGQHLTWLK